MRKLRIGIIEILGRKPAPNRYVLSTRMSLNVSIMPQSVAIWCEEDGHDVFLTYYNGYQNVFDPLPDDLDVVVMSAFTNCAQVAYALSNKFRSKGCITVLGGPHARSYPEDAAQYFDFVLGLTDKALIRDLLQGLERHRPMGVHLFAKQHPKHVASVAQRWKYIERIHQKAPWFKLVSIIGSFGCPYTCSFCIDSTLPYQPLDFGELRADLRFLVNQQKPLMVAWQDPNFGVRFNPYLDLIEEIVPPGKLSFLSESTLSLLKEDNLKRLKKNRFILIAPGIESWYSLGNKARVGKKTGLEKVYHVAEQTNQILDYIPYIQGNFVIGLDEEQGTDPFELTKQFVELSPGTYPGFSMLNAFGRSTPQNLEYQRQNRVLAVPFHFLSTTVPNVRLQHYSWIEFFDLVIDLYEHAFSNKMLFRRMTATLGWMTKVMNLIRGFQSEKQLRISQLNAIRQKLENDRAFRAFFEQDTQEIPSFFVETIKKDLGPLWPWLPEGAMVHDPNAYLKSEKRQSEE